MYCTFNVLVYFTVHLYKSSVLLLHSTKYLYPKCITICVFKFNLYFCINIVMPIGHGSDK